MIWSTPLTCASFLYWIMRYGNLVWQGIAIGFNFWGAPPVLCKTWLFLDTWISYILIIPTTLFLSLRVYSLYRDQERIHTWTMLSVFVGLHCTILAGLGVVTRDISSAIQPQTSLEDGACVVPFKQSRHTTGLTHVLAFTIYILCLFILTVGRALNHYREGNRRIYFIILQDALLYTSTLLCGSIATLIIYATQRHALRSVLINPMKNLAVIFASRIVLNLRKIVVEPEAVTFRTLTTAPMTLDTLGPISFRSRAQVDWEEGCLPLQRRLTIEDLK
ncbi:hypothetical protein PM082_013755 [Marasmius tenuissimus]|nr:hypothetical protein PM082_013755 [Marasmius tenuissimus]